ncbi:phage major capsid protein [Robertmurraya massiliosenegalensis]|uniref:phage major capsid protein n=1 Tax=Robertmurraya massiliosenegalensis TaxID=1287657 RepID=UPI0002E2A26D|nr:phage major capsid protein [Robertmurraya massiliosenegalensis]
MNKQERIDYLKNEINKKLNQLQKFKEVRSISSSDKQLFDVEVRKVENMIDELEKLEKERGDINMEKKIEKRNEQYTVLDSYLRNGETRNLQTTAYGGAVIPENVHNTIIKKMEETSPVFAKARKLPSVSGTLKIAKEHGVATNAGFVEEGEELVMDVLSLDDVKLTQKRVGAAIQLSNQLQNDAAIDIVDYSVNLLSRRLAKVIEKSILTGEKDTEFRGIIGSAIPTVTFTGVASDVEMENLQELYLAIHPDFLTGAGFVIQRNFFNAIAKKTDANGHFYLQNGIVNGKLHYTLFGLPVDITDALPDNTPVIFGNIEEAYSVMIKKGMGVTHVTADTKNALRGSRLIVLDAYMDGAVTNEQAVSKLILA